MHAVYVSRLRVVPSALMCSFQQSLWMSMSKWPTSGGSIIEGLRQDRGVGGSAGSSTSVLNPSRLSAVLRPGFSLQRRGSRVAGEHLVTHPPLCLPLSGIRQSKQSVPSPCSFFILTPLERELGSKVPFLCLFLSPTSGKWLVPNMHYHVNTRFHR